MNLQRAPEIKPRISGNTTLLYFLLACAVSVAFFQTSYAQTSPQGQNTLSDNLLNDPLAQDLLKKIEQTKKMIADLEQKEYEKSQAQEHLQQMREVSLERLNNNLDEWERLWEKQSSRNSFESFVNKKPEYVQGVFWDQFEFKEQKVNAGRIAMMQVLANGGTIQDAKEAYNKAATSKRVEIVEMNAQFNIKHNLANHAEQQIFNSSGKAHLSNATYAKLGGMYSDYKLQPSYILANSEPNKTEILDSDRDCKQGEVSVLRLTSGNKSCVEESIAKKWIDDGIQGLKIVGQDLPVSNVVITPGTQCSADFIVVYQIEKQQYQCVLESDAKVMIDQNTAEIHTLIDYVHSKDDLKIYNDTIFDINHQIHLITEQYNLDSRMIKTEIGNAIETEKKAFKHEISAAVTKYSNGVLSKEQISEKILEIENNRNIITNKLSDQLQEKLYSLESQYKQDLKSAVNGFEGNSDIELDWDYLSESSLESSVAIENNDKPSDDVKITISDDGTIPENVLLNDVNIVNSFGQSFDEIKADQILQISADISNLQNHSNDFAYVVEIIDTQNNNAQPARWITGTLNPEQNFNVSLSWIPEKTGMYSATISLGSSLDDVSQVADVMINVNPEGDPSNENYCKDGHELLFKYSDNSPICVSNDTASKLINIGLAFA